MISLYYERGEHGYSPGWIKKCKHSMASVIPRFNMGRVLHDYAKGLYYPAAQQGRQLAQDEYKLARQLAQWKQKVKAAWPGVTLRCVNSGSARIALGDRLSLEIAVQLNGLSPEDVAVEFLINRKGVLDRQFRSGGFTSVGETIETLMATNREQILAKSFTPVEMIEGGRECRYGLDFTPEWCGPLTYRIRVFPSNTLLTHPSEMGLMVWLSATHG